MDLKGSYASIVEKQDIGLMSVHSWIGGENIETEERALIQYDIQQEAGAQTEDTPLCQPGECLASNWSEEEERGLC